MLPIQLILLLFLTGIHCKGSDFVSEGNSRSENPAWRHLTTGQTLYANDTLLMSDSVTSSDNQIGSWILMVLHYFKLVIIMWGIFSNGLVYGVFYRRNRKKESTANIYLMALAMADGLMCTVVNIMGFCNELDPPLILLWMADCILVPFVVVFPSNMSIGLTMAICVERNIAVYRPIKFRQWNRKSIATKVICVLSVCIVCVNWIMFGGLKALPEDQVALREMSFLSYCKGRMSLSHVYMMNWKPWLDIAFTTVIPLLTVTISSITLASKVFCCQRNVVKKKFSQPNAPQMSMSFDHSFSTATSSHSGEPPNREEESYNQNKEEKINVEMNQIKGLQLFHKEMKSVAPMGSIAIVDEIQIATDTDATSDAAKSSVQHRTQKNALSRHSRSITSLCLAISVDFIVLQLSMILIKYISKQVGDNGGVVRQMSLVFLSIHHSVNLVLYSLVMPSFRKDLKAIFTCQ